MPDTQLDYRRLGQFVRELRQLRGWTQRELGNRAGVASNMICRLETGRQLPRFENLAAIAEAFDAKPSALLKEAGL